MIANVLSQSFQGESRKWAGLCRYKANTTFSTPLEMTTSLFLSNFN